MVTTTIRLPSNCRSSAIWQL